MTDRELLRLLLYEYDWTQGELATHLQFDQTNVSRVIKEKQQLSEKRRKLAETLLEHIQKGGES